MKPDSNRPRRKSGKSKALSPIAKYLCKARQSAGLSQLAVSKHLGYSTPQFVSNWERDVSLPPVTVLKTLAQLYRIKAEDVFDMLLKAVCNRLRSEFSNSKK